MAQKKKESLSLYRNIAMSFAGLTVLLILTMVYFSVVRATIVVTPRIQIVPLNAEVTILDEASEQTDVDALRGSIVSKEITKQDAFATTPQETMVGKATGTVRILNESTSNQTLVATTRFLASSGTLYRLEKQVVVPKGGTVTATIVADKEGKDQEVAATRWTIPGLQTAMQQKVYGITDAPTSGTRQVFAVTEQGVDIAQSTVLDAIKNEVEGGRKATHMVALEVTPLETAVSEKLGAPVRTFTLSMKARVEGILLPQDAILAWATQRLESTLPDDRRLLPLTSADVTVTLSTLRAAEGKAIVRLSAQGKTTVRNTSPIFDRQRMVGRMPNSIVGLLLADPGIEGVDVRLSPMFVKRLPRLPDHITIKIENPN